MLNPSFIPARNLQKSYKSIIKDVRLKKRPVILTTNKKPQAAIITLEDLEKLKTTKTTQAALEMLKLATDSKKELAGLPADLRERANEIIYGRQN